MNGYWVAMQGVPKYRGASDPLFLNVVLQLDGTSWTDLSNVGQTPTYTGTAPSAGTTIDYGSSTGFAKYEYEFAAENGSYCIEYWVEYTGYAFNSAPLWERYAVFGLYDGAESPLMGDGALGNSNNETSGPITLYNGIYNTFNLVDVGMALNTDLHHVAFIRNGAGLNYVFVNGYPTTSREETSEVGFIRLGNLNASSDWSSGSFHGVRATKGSARYDISGTIESGVQKFTPDALPFYAP